MEHRSEMIPGFTQKYHVHTLVYYEGTTDVKAAIAREKQLKGWTRAKKDALVSSMNPEWRDLAVDIGFESQERILRRCAPQDDME